MKSRFLPGRLGSRVSLSYEMCRQGWAFVYRQTGAVYGDLTLEDYNRIEKEAQCVAFVHPFYCWFCANVARQGCKTWCMGERHGHRDTRGI